jgi:tripartite-type tricarboxylate transporter receptor subunit TctC
MKDSSSSTFLCWLITACCGLTCTGLVFSQDSPPYPSKPIHWVIPFTASGPTDTMGRVLAQKLSEVLGESIIVENKAGAGGSIGAEFVAHAPADGYTLLFTTAGVVSVNPSLNKVGFDTMRDFAPVVKTGSLASLLVVNPNLKIKTLEEFIKLAKSKPGQLNYGSSGPGSASHLAMEMFNKMAQVNILHVPYKGAAPAVTDLLSGNIQVMLIGITPVLAFVNSGKLLALGVSSLQPSPMVPQVPTIASSGLTGFEVSNWLGLFAPINTPVAVVNKLNKEINALMKTEEVKTKLNKEGLDPVSNNSPAQFKEYVQSEIVRWAKTIKESNIQN